MFASWFRKRRRRKLLAQPFPAHWLETLEQLDLYRRLSVELKERLRRMILIFATEKSWESCGGLAITDDMRVIISAQACFMILHLEGDYFRRVSTILVYPTSYRHPRSGVRSGEIAHEGTVNAGEHWSGGPIILSWSDAEQGARNPRDGRNLVFHEFAHALDALDGWPDGVPPVGGRLQREHWNRVIGDELRELRQRIDHDRSTVLRPYAAKSEPEFFAVATECFFERPGALKREHPELYGLMAAFYRQDPAGQRPES